MNSNLRQAALVVALTTVAGIGFVIWITTSPAPAPKASVSTNSRVVMADPGDAGVRDPNAPFEPKVGQAGKDVVWVPTSEALVEKMLDLAKVTPDDHLIDLGSGDGRTVIAAARRGATAVGIEFNPDMVALSRKNAEAAGVADRAQFVQGDLFEADLSKATVITMFLLPRINMQLRSKLLELRPGTRVVSNSFNMGEWEPDATDSVTGEECRSWCNALFWVVPAQADGTWQLPAGSLELTQRFQRVDGTLAGQPIGDGALSGDRLTFRAGSTTYSAVVNGDSMTGRAGGRAFTARRTARAPRTLPPDAVAEN